MNFSELLEALQKLKHEYKINQMSIAEVLGLSRQTMSKRFQLGTQVTVKELQDIEQYYNVSIYKSNAYTQERQNDTQVEQKSSQFGKRLSELQAKHNFLDREMAKLLDITERTYISIVVGKKQPDIGVLNRIKQNFKVSIDWLLYGE